LTIAISFTLLSTLVVLPSLMHTVARRNDLRRTAT
jgi:hypothetical protein